MQFAVAQYQNATNFNVHTINGNSGQRIESVLNHDYFRSQPPEIVADFVKIVTEARTSGRTPGDDNSEAVLRCGAKGEVFNRYPSTSVCAILAWGGRK